VGNNVTATVPYGFNVSDLKASFEVSPGAELLIDNVKQSDSKTSPLDYSTKRFITVVSEDKLSQTNYMITLNFTNNSQANFISYSLPNQVGTSVIDLSAKKIKVYVDNDAALASLVPVFQVSEYASVSLSTIIQNSGITPLNYTLPFVYKVTAQNGDTVNWTITIERAKPVITLIGNAVISIDKGCVYSELGYTAKDNLGTDITAGVLVSGIIDVNTPGQYILTYTGKDVLNNESSVTRTVTVSNIACNSLGLADDVINDFVIYPNPSTGIFNIQMNKSIENTTIKVFDLSGRIVHQSETQNSESKTLDLKNIQDGTYILSIKNEDYNYSQKIIKR
jgi:hypothetical protein